MPNSFSKALICWEMADWEIKHCSAASVKLWQSTTVIKYFICLSNMDFTSYVLFYRILFILYNKICYNLDKRGEWNEKENIKFINC